MRWWIAALLVVGMLASACGGNDRPSAERQLVAVDGGHTEREYAAVLARLQPKCLEDRGRIATAAIETRAFLIRQRSITVPLLDVLRAMDQALPAGRRGSCIDAALRVTTLGQ